MSNNNLSPKQQLMVILSEECGELIQICQKILRRECRDLDDRNEDYYEKLVEEVGDVYTMIDLLHDWDIISWEQLEERRDYKIEKLKKWSDLI